MAKMLPQNLITIIRGLLAESVEDYDNPFEPVILKSLTSTEAIDFASCAQNSDSDYPADLAKTDLPPLYIDPKQLPDEADSCREKLKQSIDSFAGKHNSKPKIICLKGQGVLYIGSDSSKNALPLKNKVALITGAAGAIGYGICLGLLEKGCYLAASDLAGEKFDAFIEDLKQIDSERVLGVPIDVTSKDCVTKGFETIAQTWGGVDIVIVNAGIAHVCELKDMELDAFQKLEKVNVEGTLLTISETARQLILQQTGGDIVVMSTKNVPCPGASFGAYSATKAACHQLGRIASLELAQYGVRVNMVAPDAVFSQGKHKSGLWQEVGPGRMKARGLDEKGLQEYYKNRNLLKISVTGRHVANAVIFFVTRQTPTTGATIPVDGGLPDATPR